MLSQAEDFILDLSRVIHEKYRIQKDYEEACEVIARLKKEIKTLEEDGVCVIRCKDCKWREHRICNNIEFWECNHLRYENTKVGVTDDWFCADAERKEE